MKSTKKSTKGGSSGTNKGFRVDNNKMYTYEQVRNGFSHESSNRNGAKVLVTVS